MNENKMIVSRLSSDFQRNWGGLKLDNAFGWIIAGMLPIVTIWTFSVPRVALDCFTDSVFYLSYARQFEELVLRFGFPYYAVRFGGILPDAVSGHLFGSINGIWILRWTLMSLVSIVLYVLFKRRYGFWAGLMASALWSFNPAALRLACTTYVDSTSVPFLLLGSCLWCMGTTGVIMGFLIGILFALAVSAHLYAAVALVLLIPLLLGARWDNGLAGLKSVGWVLAGFIFTFAVAWFWYWSVWGMPALFSPTLEVMHDIASGKGACWKQPLLQAVKSTPAWLTPIVLIPVSLIGMRRGSNFLRGAAISLILSTLFFLGGDIMSNAFVLSLPFYYSFLLPVTVITSGTLCAEAVSRIPRYEGAVLFSGIIIGGAAVLLIMVSRHLVPSLLAINLIIMVTALLQILRRKLRMTEFSIITITSILLSCFIVGTTGSFTQMVQGNVRNDSPVIELAEMLRRQLPKASDDQKVTRFWCDDNKVNRGGIDRRMIDSFWLNTFGMLRGDNEESVEFAKIRPEDAEAISRSSIDRIVIFDQEEDQVTRAIEAIKKNKLPFHVQKVGTLKAASDVTKQLGYAVLERNEDVRRLLEKEIDLKKCRFAEDARVIHEKKGELLQSGKKKWKEFAVIPIGHLTGRDEIILKGRITSGRVRIALKDGTGHPVQSSDRWAMNSVQEIRVKVPQEIPDAFLSFENLYPNGANSKIILNSAQVSTCE